MRPPAPASSASAARSGKGIRRFKAQTDTLMFRLCANRSEPEPPEPISVQDGQRKSTPPSLLEHRRADPATRPLAPDRCILLPAALRIGASGPRRAGALGSMLMHGHSLVHRHALLAGHLFGHFAIGFHSRIALHHPFVAHALIV